MAKKADAWKEYQDAAMIDMVLETLPKVMMIVCMLAFCAYSSRYSYHGFTHRPPSSLCNSPVFGIILPPCNPHTTPLCSAGFGHWYLALHLSLFHNYFPSIIPIILDSPALIWLITTALRIVTN